MIPTPLTEVLSVCVCDMQALKEDIEASQADLEDVQQTGDMLMGLVGQAEQPEVQKTVEDTSANLAAISDQYNQRSQQLEHALAKATHFQDELMVRKWIRTLCVCVCVCVCVVRTLCVSMHAYVCLCV